MPTTRSSLPVERGAAVRISRITSQRRVGWYHPTYPAYETTCRSVLGRTCAHTFKPRADQALTTERLRPQKTGSGTNGRTRANPRQFNDLHRPLLPGSHGRIAKTCTNGQTRTNPVKRQRDQWLMKPPASNPAFGDDHLVQTRAKPGEHVQSVQGSMTYKAGSKHSSSRRLPSLANSGTVGRTRAIRRTINNLAAGFSALDQNEMQKTGEDGRTKMGKMLARSKTWKAKPC